MLSMLRVPVDQVPSVKHRRHGTGPRVYSVLQIDLF